jgi:hypothetical protein
MIDVLQRSDWYGAPMKQGELFQVRKARGRGKLNAACELWTHPLGWEVRLIIDGKRDRSEVSRSQNDVLSTCQRWQAAMIEKGWRRTSPGTADGCQWMIVILDTG